MSSIISIYSKTYKINPLKTEISHNTLINNFQEINI